MSPTPARASTAVHSLLRRTRCVAAANRIRPTARAFSSAAPAGATGPQDGPEKVGGVKAGDDEVDVAIVGGGMVGLAVACALSNMPLTKHLRVAIIDSNPALKSRGYLKKDGIPDSRVSTVTPATISFFRDIGAWEHIQNQRHAFFGKMQVWDYTGLGYTRYNARDVCKEYLGCVVENKVLCNSLLLRLQEQKEDIEEMPSPAQRPSRTFPPMALLRALRRALPPLSSPAASLLRRAPDPPLPFRPLRLLDPIGPRPFSAAAAATATAVARAPVMGASLFKGLTETRFPKRRPGFVSRRKRASLRPKGPHFWVMCKPGEPIPASQPNKGSVKGRKEKKRIKQRKDFIMSEKRKRKAQYSVAVKRKEAERTERKMAAVARDRAWVERLAELQQIEAEKKAATA